MFWHGSAAGVVPGGLSFCLRTLILLCHFNAIFRLTWLFYGVTLCKRLIYAHVSHPASSRQLVPRASGYCRKLRHNCALAAKEGEKKTGLKPRAPKKNERITPRDLLDKYACARCMRAFRRRHFRGLRAWRNLGRVRQHAAKERR